MFCRAKQITGLYMKRNTELKWFKEAFEVSQRTAKIMTLNFAFGKIFVDTRIGECSSSQAF